MKNTVIHNILKQEILQKQLLTSFQKLTGPGGDKKLKEKIKKTQKPKDFSEKEYYSIFASVMGNFTLNLQKKEYSHFSFIKIEETSNRSRLEVSTNINKEIKKSFSKRQRAQFIKEFLNDNPRKDYWEYISAVFTIWIHETDITLFKLIEDKEIPTEHDACAECLSYAKLLLKDIHSERNNEIKDKTVINITPQQELDKFSETDILFGFNQLQLATYYINRRFKQNGEIGEYAAERFYLRQVLKNKLCKIEFTEKERVEDIEDLSDWISQKETAIKAIAKKIIEKTNDNPLMSYLFKDKKRFLPEYLSLINARVDIDTQEVVTDPLITTLTSDIQNMVRKYLKAKFFTEKDFYDILGEFALNATKNSANNYSISLESLISDTNEITNKIKSAIKADIDSGKADFIVKNENMYRFRLKHYRLFFAAIYKSNKFNSMNGTPEKIAEKILCEVGFYKKNPPNLQEKTVENKTDTGPIIKIPQHAKMKFDSLVVYMNILFLNLRSPILYSLVDKLLLISDDFSVKNRPVQEAAIAIVSNLIYEKQLSLSDTDKKIILKIFGRNCYFFQLGAWTYIYNKYKEYINDSINNALTLDENGYTKENPYYILLKGYVTPTPSTEKNKSTQTLFDLCCLVQSLTWESLNNATEIDESIISQLNDYIIEIHGKWFYNEWEDFPSKDPTLVYACDMLLYALADTTQNKNIINLTTTAGKRLSTLHLIKITVICDYLNRKLSRPYNEKFGKEKPLPETKKGSERKEVFLLCGPFRVTSNRDLLTYMESNGNERFLLPQDIYEDYKLWLSNESQDRYKILLIRLLLFCTDFFEKENHKFGSFSKDIEFLEYDEINDIREEVIKALNENIEPNELRERFINKMKDDAK